MKKEPLDHVTQVDYNKIDADLAEEKKNDKFVQFYEDKLKDIRAHTLLNPKAVVLFLYLAEHMGPDNIVIIPQSILEEELNISRSTLHRATAYLVDNNLVVIVKFGNCNGYAMNPEYVWKSFNTPEKYMLFTNVKAMASKSENEAVRKKLHHVLGRKKPGKTKLKQESSVDPRQTDLVELCESKADI